MGFIQKFEVQKGRTVTCLQGIVHEGGILTSASFSGDDEEAKKKLIVALVKLGAMKPVPLTDAEKEALAEAKKEDEARIKKKAAAEKAETEAKAKKETEEKAAAEKAENEAKAKKETREAALLDADFDSMNKDPMIKFAEDHGIELKATLAEDIREELKALQESLTAPE